MASATDDVEVTIIVPVFDRDESLRRAVGGILALPDRVSVVIVDDGSAPKFAAVADELATAGGPFVQAVHQINLGPAAARNKGLTLTRSRFVMFLDSDDELTDAAIPAIERCLVGRNDVGMLSGALRVVDANGGSRTDYPAVLPGVPWANLAAGHAGAFVVRTEIAQRVGGYDEALHFGENTDFILRVAEECRRRSLRVLATNEVFATHYAARDERRYDAKRLEAAVHLLRRGRFDLQLRSERAKLHGIAAVNAARVGRYGISVRHAVLAAVTDPRNPRHLLRLVVSLSGPVAKRWWLGAE